MWDFYETFKTKDEAQQYKRENRGRKTSRIEEIYTITDISGDTPIYGIMYQVGGKYIL